MHLQNKNYFTFDLCLWVKVTGNVAQYPLYHVTYASVKFEVTFVMHPIVKEMHLQENISFDL